MKRASMMILVLACTTFTFAQNAKTVFLVRHAEKASEARDALLSDIGKQRAMCLAGVLADANVQKIITSDVKRTQQTAQPLADRLHEKLTILPASDIARFANEIRGAQGNTLVVAHSDTLPNIIQQLTGKTVTIGSNEYDRLFMVSFGPDATAPVVLHFCSQSQPAPPPQKMMRRARLLVGIGSDV